VLGQVSGETLVLTTQCLQVIKKITSDTFTAFCGLSCKQVKCFSSMFFLTCIKSERMSILADDFKSEHLNSLKTNKQKKFACLLSI